MTITFVELKEKLKQKDVNDLVEILCIESDELIERFDDKIDERYEELIEEFLDGEEESYESD